MKTIYFDLDGVLADWCAGFEAANVGCTIAEFNTYEREKRDEIKARFVTGEFYRNLPIIEEGVILFREYEADDRYVVKILSATGDHDSEAVAIAKEAWVREFISETTECFFVRKVEEKARYATPDSVLIDDREKAIIPFIEAGGIGVLFELAD